jgi:hypothetical protein
MGVHRSVETIVGQRAFGWPGRGVTKGKMVRANVRQSLSRQRERERAKKRERQYGYPDGPGHTCRKPHARQIKCKGAIKSHIWKLCSLQQVGHAHMGVRTRVDPLESTIVYIAKSSKIVNIAKSSKVTEVARYEYIT